MTSIIDNSEPSPGPPALDDLLWGVSEIARYLGRPHRQTTYLLETRRIPAGKCGRLWVASRSELQTYFKKLARGEGP